MLTQFWDVLFPPTCVGCKRSGNWICNDCLQSVRRFERARCRLCGGKQQGKHTCDQAWPFDSCVSVGSYGDPVWQQALKQFKYRSATCLEERITTVLKQFREDYLDPWPWAGLDALVVCPVPTDELRRKSRGIDHTEILARIVRETLVPWATQEPLLRRTRKAQANATLEDDRLRQANVHNVFAATRPINGAVLLVDDVLTSGATLVEATKTLKKAGASQVHVLVFAKAGTKRGK